MRRLHPVYLIGLPCLAGNRMLHDGYSPFIGPSAGKRFGHEVLDRPGVRGVLMLEGTNDIVGNIYLGGRERSVSAEQIIAGLQALSDRAHRRGIKVWGGTLLPMGGAEWPFHTVAGQAVRQRVNDWIRHGGVFDAVADFDAALRDQEHPDRLAPAFDSGDHLHPNDAGHQAMAGLLDLRLLQQDLQN